MTTKTPITTLAEEWLRLDKVAFFSFLPTCPEASMNLFFMNVNQKSFV